MPSDTPRRARRTRIHGLIALNGVLVAILAAVSFGPDAEARQGAGRPRGNYTMVGLKAQGIPESAVVIVDSTNQQLIATRWDRSRRTLSGIGFRDLAADAARVTGGGR